MKRLLILGGILLSQNPAFSQYQCPSGTAKIGQPEYRKYQIVGWKGDQNGYRCEKRTYLECGDLTLSVWANANLGSFQMLSKQNVWVEFTDASKVFVNERRGYNKSNQEVYYQKIESRFFRAPGVSRLLQISTVDEQIQKCGSYSF